MAHFNFLAEIDMVIQNVTDEGDSGKRVRGVLRSRQSAAGQHVSAHGTMRGICTTKALNQPPPQRR